MFIRTENGEKSKVSNMLFVRVEPDDATNIWELLVDTFDKNGRSTGTKLIAQFDSVKKANNARLSLQSAHYQNLGWDAIEYLKENQ